MYRTVHARGKGRMRFNPHFKTVYSISPRGRTTKYEYSSTAATRQKVFTRRELSLSDGDYQDWG